jgi:hypothetical protein
MRIVWKDSRAQKEYKPIRYRGYMIWGSSAGWEITVPGDHNIYANHYSAQNAIDQYFGDFGQHGTEKRKKYGIQIKKDSGTA